MKTIRASQPKLKNLPLFAIIKEVAPTGKIRTDEELGVREFQTKYFDGNPVYIDEQKRFYNALGNRKLLRDTMPTWNPFKLYSAFRKLSKRLKDKPDIEGNFAGEGIVLGGVLVIGRGEQGVLHEYLEQSGLDPEKWIAGVRDSVLGLVAA